MMIKLLISNNNSIALSGIYISNHKNIGAFV